MKNGIKWILLSLFLLVLGVIQFIPDEAASSRQTPETKSLPAQKSAEPYSWPWYWRWS
ncbi:MAG: hypothetical protein NWQ45_09010 [Congregibacter sp.]|nr:hypothetical protein [Congregibacter sp.]